MNDSAGSVMDDSLRGVGSGAGERQAEAGEAMEDRWSGPLKQTRADYYTVPGPEELAGLVGADGRCEVAEGFTVGRQGYGSVFWPGPLDVGGLDLDALIHFRHKEVVVYPDEAHKPPEGKELNRPAEVPLAFPHF